MFADNLTALRKAKKMTQTQFASEFNISSGTIGMWESGSRTPDVITMNRIAGFFGVPIDFLINGCPVSWEHQDLYDDFDRASDQTKIEMVEKMGIDCRVASSYFAAQQRQKAEKAATPKDGDPLTEEFNSYANQLNPDEMKLVLAQIKGILSNR